MSNDEINNKIYSMHMQNTRSVSASSWALSFADIVTVLLCFFIIFYAIEKKIGYKTDKIIPEQNVVDSKIEIIDDPQLKKIINSIEAHKDMEVYKTPKFIIINFKNIEFFTNGSTTLTQKGKVAVGDFLREYRSIQNKFRIEIQGFSDNSKVRIKENRGWKSNIELSLVRALDVYHYLIKNKINKKLLSVTGYGSNKNQGKNKIKKFHRRIQFKLEPKEL